MRRISLPNRPSEKEMETVYYGRHISYKDLKTVNVGERIQKVLHEGGHARSAMRIHCTRRSLTMACRLLVNDGFLHDAGGDAGRGDL